MRLLHVPFRPASSRWSLLALLLLAAPPAWSAEPASLELTYGPGEPRSLALEGLRVFVDGAEIAVSTPAAGTDPAVPFGRGPIAAGNRKVEVEASLVGQATPFTYVDGYRFKMRGQVGVVVLPGDLIGLNARVVANDGVTVQWQDRYRLALTARVQHSPRALEEAVAATQAEPATEPAAAPVAPPAPAPVAAPVAAPPAVAVVTPVATPSRSSGTCALGPVRFAFDSAAITPAAREALDAFAACLAGTAGQVQLTGHWDQFGDPDYNVQLGERRAAAAAAALEAAGVAAARLHVVRSPATSPLCTEATRACWAQNRRVEAIVTP